MFRGMSPVHADQPKKQKSAAMFSPKPNSFWLVVYECRLTVVTVSPQGDGFFAPGQEPLWALSAVTEWIREIKAEENVISHDYYVIKSGKTGFYATDVLPDTTRERYYRFLCTVNDADTFMTFDEATKIVDDYIDPDGEPIIEHIRKTQQIELLNDI